MTTITPVVRIPHTCDLPENFINWPPASQRVFVEAYHTLARREYTLRQRAIHEEAALKEYQGDLIQAVQTYFLTRYPEAAYLTSDVITFFWQNVKRECISELFGESMMQMVDTSIHQVLSSLTTIGGSLPPGRTR